MNHRFLDFSNQVDVNRWQLAAVLQIYLTKCSPLTSAYQNTLFKHGSLPLNIFYRNKVKTKEKIYLKNINILLARCNLKNLLNHFNKWEFVLFKAFIFENTTWKTK